MTSTLMKKGFGIVKKDKETNLEETEGDLNSDPITETFLKISFFESSLASANSEF